ncbi:MAG: HAMP domain-containing histidine kinase [Bacilli bacterium]|nr:HAMP domain-containing histidine kinase [Bacilli bacterium]
MTLSPFLYVNLTSAVCCVLFFIFLFFSYFSKKNMNNFENRIYKHLLISNGLAAISYVCFYSFDIICFYSTNQDLFYSITYIFSKASVVFIVIWFVFLFLYVLVVTNQHREKFYNFFIKNEKKVFIFTYIFLFFYCIYGALEHSVIRLDIGVEENLLLFTNICIWFVEVSCLILILSNIKHMEKKKALPIFAIIPISILAFGLGIFDVPIVFILVLVTVINHLMYHTIENPDMKLINELTLAKNQAEKANNAKTDFLSSMSHELRTPLNAIVGFSQMIDMSDDLDEIHQDSKDIILASQNLLELVNGILDINKLEANKMELVPVNYNLINELNDLIRLINIRIGDKPLELVTNYSTLLPNTLYGDKDKLKAIISNLLTNAVKYTESGKVTFSVDCQNIKNKCNLIITVSDTGRGMKEEQMAKLFTKFNRLDEDKDSDIEGTGLGLAITKSLVELFNGSIDVSSTYGEGSTFIVKISQDIVSDSNAVTTEVSDVI